MGVIVSVKSTRNVQGYEQWENRKWLRAFTFTPPWWWERERGHFPPQSERVVWCDTKHQINGWLDDAFLVKSSPLYLSPSHTLRHCGKNRSAHFLLLRYSSNLCVAGACQHWKPKLPWHKFPFLGLGNNSNGSNLVVHLKTSITSNDQICTSMKKEWPITR